MALEEEIKSRGSRRFENVSPSTAFFGQMAHQWSFITFPKTIRQRALPAFQDARRILISPA
jgi:hypothetical protein